MKATIHYDNGNTAPVTAKMYTGGLHYIEFRYNGETYVLGHTKLAEHGIIQVTKDSNGKTLWSLN
ncbi:hypothetical protein F4Z99_04140 [Candidatus Poribacteria bacterium]|nr:hypothetical protein [Candidatus Poribacteria bacterium]MYB02485.1 hypothetical protein [Candidatus Poribacteria bacterium]